MAIVRAFTGFEMGEDLNPVLFFDMNGAVFLDDGNAPTGQWSLYCNGPGPASAGFGYAIFKKPDPIGLVNGNYANANMRCRFVLEQTIPTSDGMAICGFSEEPVSCSGLLVIDSNGHFAARAGDVVGTYSTAVLAIDTEYIAEVLVNVLDNAGDADITVTVNVYNAAQELIESCAAIEDNGNASTPYQIFPCSVGHTDVENGDYFVRFDDVVYVIEDEGLATLPLDSNGGISLRVTRIDPTSVSLNNGWTFDSLNAYYPVNAIPADDTDYITSGVDDGRISFGHASNLEVTGVKGVQLYARAKIDVNDNVWFAFNTNLHSVALTNAFALVTQQVWGDISNADFNTLTIGIKNKATRTTDLAQLYGEVLHSGNNYWPTQFLGVDSWKHKVITWTGDGEYHEITGVGFKSQFILVKKSAGTASSGLVKFGFMGGTKSKSNTTSDVDSRGIMLINDDGFTLGPSSNCNENGIEYAAVCIQDGGFNFHGVQNYDCRFARFGAYVGSTIDDRDITVFPSWPGYFVYVSGNTSFWANTGIGVEETVRLSISNVITDVIQSIGNGGFQVGTLANVRDIIYYWFAFQDDIAGDILEFMNYDKLVGVGTSMSSGNLGLDIDFLTIKRISTADAQWRQLDIQIGANSNLWSGVGTNVTGITDITGEAFTIDSTLCQPAADIWWWAFSDEGEILESSSVPTVDAGPDDSLNAFDTISLQGSGDEGNYLCASNPPLFQWSKISGPGIVGFDNFTSPTSLVTFNASGIYVLQLQANNGPLTATDTVTITVINAAPVCDAGPSQTILVADTATLAGSASDDGLPIPPGTLVITWSKLSGPGTVVFSNNHSLTSTATFSTSGKYTLQLSAYDGEKTSTDTVVILVLNACVLPGADPSFSC